MDEIRPHLDLVYSYTAFFVAYLIGSLSFAVIVSKLMRLPDPRTYGSNNPGATNVLRSGSKKAAALTLLLDALKGYVPTVLVAHFAPDLGFEDTTIAFVGLSAFLGHLYPVFFRFKGGKGVATALGVLLALEPLLGLATLAVWVIMAAGFRYSSLASIAASVMAPFLMLMFFDRPEVALAITVMSLLLIWRHWRNIMNLIAGKESRLGAKPGDGSRPHRSGRRSRRHKLGDGSGSASSTSTHSKGN